MKLVSRLSSRSSCLPVVTVLARLRLCSSRRTMKRCGQLKTRGRFLKNKYFPAWVSRFARTINPACFQHAAIRGSILRISILHCFFSCLPVVAVLSRFGLGSSRRTRKRCGHDMQLKTRSRFFKNKYFPAWVPTPTLVSSRCFCGRAGPAKRTASSRAHRQSCMLSAAAYLSANL